MLEHQIKEMDTLTRLVLCAAAGAGIVYLCEKLLPGRNISLWESYGPWVQENRAQAIALAAGVLYVLSLLLWPEEKTEEEGFEPCG